MVIFFNKPLALKLCRDLWKRRLIIFAIIMVLMVGVGSYVGMAGVYLDLDKAKNEYYRLYNLADFTLDLKRTPESLIKTIENTSNVLQLRSRISTDIMVRLPNLSNQIISGTAVSLPVPRQNIINDIKLINGTWFSAPYAKEAIVLQNFADARHLKVGDRIKVRLPDQEHEVLIVGITAAPEFTIILVPGNAVPDPANFMAIFMPHKFLQRATNLDGNFNQLLGTVKNKTLININNTMNLLADKLDNYGVQLQTAQHDQVSVQALRDELTQVKKSTSIYPSMFFLVAILVLNVMISRLVVQQRTHIGTLKALGYNNLSIMLHFLSYGVVIGLVGGILGCGVGFVLQYLMLGEYQAYYALPNLTFHIHLSAILSGILISIGSAILGAILGTYRAARLDPVEAMRPPAPEKSVHIIFENFPKLWKALSFQNKMILRAIFRNRIRSVVTVAASILATALVFSSLELLDSVYAMIDFSFDKMQHQDYTITLREPLGNEIMRTAATLQNVAKIEGQLTVASELKNGPYLKRLEIIGLPLNNQLSTPVDKNDRDIKVNSSGLILDTTLAKILHVKTGDKIIVRPLIGNRTEAKVTVTGLIDTYLGLSVYAEKSWLSRLIGNSDVSNSVLFKLNPHADTNIFIAAANKFAPLINITSRLQQKQLLLKTFDEFLIFVIVILITFAGVIAIGSVINTSMISLSERERDVASLRILGFTNFHTAKIFLGESLILNAIGIFLGLFAGILFAYYLSFAFSTELYRMPFFIRWPRLLETTIIMLGFVLISQFIVYRIIKKMNWFEVLNIRE